LDPHVFVILLTTVPVAVVAVAVVARFFLSLPVAFLLLLVFIIFKNLTQKLNNNNLKVKLKISECKTLLLNTVNGTITATLAQRNVNRTKEPLNDVYCTLH
jgi:hypothetical protein